MEYKDWKKLLESLEDLHFLANMYRINGHMEKDVMGPYSTLYRFIHSIEHKEEPKSNIIDFYKK